MNIMSLFDFSLKCYDVGLLLKEAKGKVKNRKWNKLAKRNVELKKYKTSDKCYICGNGPSLKKVNLDELNGDTIVMNDHWRIAPNFKTMPNYYIVNDEAYGMDSFRERLKGVLDCYPEMPHLFASNIGRAIEEKFPETKTNIYYFNPIGPTFKHTYKIDFTKVTYNVWNVVTTAIELAVYLGYKEICLIGCDYSLFASKYMTHVYDKDGVKVACPVKLGEMLYKYSFTTHIHYEMAQYAREHGIKVINMTTESLLDAYDMEPNSKY